MNAIQFSSVVKQYGAIRAVNSLDLSMERGQSVALIGAMLQEGDLVPGLKVRELIDFIRRRYPDPLGLDEILRLADLTELVDRRTDKLSGGQAERVRFALAIAGQPHLLVLDEPTAAMDASSRRAFWASMRAYAAQGHTILFATRSRVPSSYVLHQVSANILPGLASSRHHQG